MGARPSWAVPGNSGCPRGLELLADCSVLVQKGKTLRNLRELKILLVKKSTSLSRRHPLCTQVLLPSLWHLSFQFSGPVSRSPWPWAQLFWGFPGGSAVKNLRCRSRGRCGFNPWVWKIPWRRARNPPQYSCLEKPRDRGAGEPQSTGSQRVRHDWCDSHACAVVPLTSPHKTTAAYKPTKLSAWLSSRK